MIGLGDYYSREISVGVIDIYWQGLQNYDLKAVQKAFQAHIANPDNGQFMPQGRGPCPYARRHYG
jgi:hypothetical protein